MSTDRPTVGNALWDVHEIPKTRAYIRSVWDRREYMTYVATNELRARHMNTVLGNAWHLLNPLLQMAIFYLIFGVLLGVDRGVDNFIAFLAVGMFMFGFTQRATTAGANSIVNNRGLLSALPFPRALLPITSTMTEALATLSPMVVIYIVALLTGETPEARWLLLPFLFVIQFVFNLGAALTAARATNVVRDVTQLLPLLFRLLFYSSGVIFNPEPYLKDGNAHWFFDLNPLYCIVTLGRWCILGGEFRPELLLILLIWTVALSTFGFIWFRRGEADYGRD